MKSIIHNFHSHSGTVHSSQQPTLSATDLNTSELVDLLQRSAVEQLTTYRLLEARDFGSVASQQTLRRCTRTNMATISGVYSCLHKTFTRCCMLFACHSFQHIRSLFSCWMMTLSHWLHWHWLWILNVGTGLAISASLSWLCRCIWWLSVSWSYVTQWRHWLRHSTTFKSLREDVQPTVRWTSSHWSW